MSEANPIVDAQRNALMELLRQTRERQYAEVSEQAQAQQHKLLAQAHREARTRMHSAVMLERSRAEHQLVAARAQLQTRARQRQYQVALALLAEGWEQLQGALDARWRDPDQRRQWILALLEQGLQVLPSCPWRIQHPADWQTAELAEAAERVQRHCGSEPQWQPDPDLTAGLRIYARHACLDGTHRGLLADRTAVEARILAELDRLLGNGSRGGVTQPGGTL